MQRGLVRQNHVLRAGTCTYIQQILRNVISWPCPWYLLLAHRSPNDHFPNIHQFCVQNEHTGAYSTIYDTLCIAYESSVNEIHLYIIQPFHVLLHQWNFNFFVTFASRWRHNESDGVSNHQLHDCLLNRLFTRKSKKKSKLRVTVLCARNSPVTSEFPHKGPVTRKIFPFDDVIMGCHGVLSPAS